MGRFKFLIFVIIAALLSCYKIPSKPPVWQVRINIPLGDSVLTAQEVIDDTTINHKFTIERDPLYNDTLWAIFHYSDTAVWTPPIRGDTILSMTIYQNVHEDIDTTVSYFDSETTKLIVYKYLHGRCDSAFDGTVGFLVYPPDSLHQFDEFTDSVQIHISETANLDTMMTFVMDTFPLGPYRIDITLYHDAGIMIPDSAMGYSKMPLDFLSKGDTIITYLKGIKVKEEIQDTISRDTLYPVERIILHLEFSNRTSAAFTGNFRIGTKDSLADPYNIYRMKPFVITPAPHDSFGFTIGPHTKTIIEDTLTDKYTTMLDSDSLFWRATLAFPALGKVFLKPNDWIRLYGFFSIDLWVDTESSEGE
ncbi:hypothetical protein KAW96_11165 [candidate division WOR-3 bacterium]|nr:hypothetical protein [candidate division WOR-3 bacterium]